MLLLGSSDVPGERLYTRQCAERRKNGGSENKSLGRGVSPPRTQLIGYFGQVYVHKCDLFVMVPGCWGLGGGPRYQMLLQEEQTQEQGWL